MTADAAASERVADGGADTRGIPHAILAAFAPVAQPDRDYWIRDMAAFYRLGWTPGRAERAGQVLGAVGQQAAA